MNKTDLVKVVKDTVSETLEGVTAKDTAIFVDATIKAIQDAVVAGDKVSIVGFGTFETTERAARMVETRRQEKTWRSRLLKHRSSKLVKHLKTQ